MFWMHGELANIDNITLHHNGLLSLETGGHTKDLDPDYYQFNWVRIQENANPDTNTMYNCEGSQF
jgi:hypothetical protein